MTETNRVKGAWRLGAVKLIKNPYKIEKITLIVQNELNKWLYSKNTGVKGKK